MSICLGQLLGYSIQTNRKYSSPEEYAASNPPNYLILMQSVPVQDIGADEDYRPSPEDSKMCMTQRLKRPASTEAGQPASRQVRAFQSPIEQLVLALRKPEDKMQMLSFGWYETCDYQTRNTTLSKVHFVVSVLGKDQCVLEQRETANGTRLILPDAQVLELNTNDRHKLEHMTCIYSGKKGEEDIYQFISSSESYQFFKDTEEEFRKNNK